jgi:hypothetical protein
METTQAELAQPDQSVEEGTPITPEIAGTLQSPPKLMTESEFRMMRRMHFTVRHGRVDVCGHRFDSITEPRNNCEYCWWAFFKSHGELVQVTDRAYQEQGSDFVDKLRGVKYRKNFLKFMATLAKFQAEAAQTQDPALTDIKDYCLVCDKEIPPGPDFCSAECEKEDQCPTRKPRRHRKSKSSRKPKRGK